MSYQQSLAGFGNHGFESEHDYINITAQDGAPHDPGYKDDYEVAHSVYSNLPYYNATGFYPFHDHETTEPHQYPTVLQPGPPAPAIPATMPPTKLPSDDKVLALMQVFTQVKEQTTDRELFRFDIDYNIEFHAKDFNSYAEFRNVLRYKTQAGYLKTQFFRICLLSEIEKYRAPINRLDLSMLAKPDQKIDHESAMNTIKWIVDKRTLDEALATYRAELLKGADTEPVPNVALCPWNRTGNASASRENENSRRLKLAVVRFTKAQALSLCIDQSSNEYKYYEEVVCKKRPYMRTPSDTGRYMGEWLRGDLRLDEDIVVQCSKHNSCKPKGNVIQENDRIKFVAALNEFSVPRTLGYVTVRNDVITDFLDFVIDLQQGCIENRLSPLVALSKMPQYAEFYRSFIEPELKHVHEPAYEPPAAATTLDTPKHVADSHDETKREEH